MTNFFTSYAIFEISIKVLLSYYLSMPRHTQNKINFDKPKAKYALNPKLLAVLKEPEHHSTIQQFWQGIENRNAKMEGRKPKAISVKTANRGFFRALQASPNKSPYAKDAEALLRKLPIWKTPPAIAHYKTRMEQDKNFIPENPRIKTQKAIAHFEMQAQKIRKEIQNCPAGPQLASLRKQAALYSGLAMTLTVTTVRMDAKGIEQLSNNPLPVLISKDPVVKAYKDFEKLIWEAAKLGLGNDPYLHDWLVSHDNPRAATRKKMKPIPDTEVTIHNAIDDMWDQGFSWRKIHRELMRQSIMANKNWSTFYRWIKNRDFLTTYGRVNQKI